MANRLKEIYAELQILREAICKLGPLRRIEQVGQLKYNLVDQLYDEYLGIFESSTYKLEVLNLSVEEANLIENICLFIQKLYRKIYSYDRGNTNKDTTMAKFDLKTAVSLIPVMDNSEDTTKRMIDSIDLYSTMIEATEQSSLINFVLKTRLTESAKLRLEKTYASCSSLITDIRKHLLTTKSSTALHSQLLTCNQGSRSIEEYGKSLEDLFTQLTVSQADGNTSAYNVLKPLNEKLAVHRFADGLRNKNLSLILTARNYDSLKDAIQAGKEEELSSNRSEPRECMFYARRGGRGNLNQVRYPSYNQQGRGGATQRGNRAYFNNYSTRSPFGQRWTSQNSTNYFQNYSRSDKLRGRRPFVGQRPRGGQFYRSRGSSTRGHNMHYLNNQEQGQVSDDNNTTETQFFRS